jgi:8-oxo-dGTP diphosphatase
VRVVAALITRDGDILIQQRPVGSMRAGLWEFPGGKTEPGETDAQALQRECVEELGVSVSVGACVWQGEHAYDDLIVTLALFACTVDDGEPKPVYGQQLIWVQRARITDYEFVAADVPVLGPLSRGEL